MQDSLSDQKSESSWINFPSGRIFCNTDAQSANR